MWSLANMRFRLAVNVIDFSPDISTVIKELETILNSPMIHDHTAYGSASGKKWRIDLCWKYYAPRGTFPLPTPDGWELRIHKRYTNNPQFTNFLLRWT